MSLPSPAPTPFTAISFVPSEPGIERPQFFPEHTQPAEADPVRGTFGGPIVHNRTFFFGGYQGNRVRSTLGGLAPCSDQRQPRRQLLCASRTTNPNNPLARRITILDPVTRQPFPDNIIPENRFDAAGAAFLEHIPRADGNRRIRYGRAIHTNYDEFIGKIIIDLLPPNAGAFATLRISSMTPPASTAATC